MPLNDKLHEFRNETIRVTWSRTRCIHAAACVALMPEVFQPGERPWIRLEGAEAEEVARVVRRCPTGALHFTREDGGPAEAPEPRNVVRLTRNGPLYLRGDVELRDAVGNVLLRDTRMALCRCGASTHRPLCDNAHLESGFRDAGRITDLDGVQDPGPVPEDRRLVVTTERDGSLRLEGPFVLSDADGTTLLEGTTTWLCRCGQSRDKPFCDGSHERAGFRDQPGA